MSKKYGFIFLGLGIILLGLAGLSMYTDLFKTDEPEPDNPPDNPIVVFKTYDSIKTKDINKKTKITFPIIDDLAIDSLHSDYYNKYYANTDNTINILGNIYNENTLSSFVTSDYQDNYQSLQNDGYKVESNDIECSYICKRYKVYKDNQLYSDELKIFIQSSDIDIAKITYKSSLNELADDLIKSIIENITISYDATYQNSEEKDGKLYIKLSASDNKTITLILDSNIYEEVADKNSNKNTINVNNKNTNTKTFLHLRIKQFASTIKKDIDMYYNMTNPGSNVKEIMVDNKVIYQYDINGNNSYAYIIDDDCALLINSDSDSIELSDFLNIQ